MSHTPLVRIRRTTTRSGAPQPQTSHHYRVLEDTADGERELETFTVMMDSEERCYQNAFLSALSYAQGKELGLIDEVSDMGLVPAEELCNPVYRMTESPPEQPTACHAQTSTSAGCTTIDFPTEEAQTHRSYFFILMLLPVWLFGMSTWQDLVGRIFLTLMVLSVAVIIVMYHRSQNKFYGHRWVRLEKGTLAFDSEKKDMAPVDWDEIQQITATPLGVFVFGPNMTRHFPMADLEAARWLRGVIQHYRWGE